MCGCGRTSSPLPGASATGPIWSKNTNGPTLRFCAAGSERRTVKPSPRSRVRGTMMVSSIEKTLMVHGGARSRAAGASHMAFNERRTRLIYLSISLAVMCALLICLLIAIAFLDALITADLSQLVAILFMLSMMALIGSLSIFLREIFLGVNTARVAIR